MDPLAEALDRVRLSGTVLFHYKLGHPWSLALPAFSDAVFHYLSSGSATLALEPGRKLRMTEGDFVLVTRGEPHVIYSDRRPISASFVTGRLRVTASARAQSVSSWRVPGRR